MKERFFTRINRYVSTLFERSKKEVAQILKLEQEYNLTLYCVPLDHLWRVVNILTGTYLEKAESDVLELLGVDYQQHPIVPGGKVPDHYVRVGRRDYYLEEKNHSTRYRRGRGFWRRQNSLGGLPAEVSKILVIPKLRPKEREYFGNKGIHVIEIGRQIIGSSPFDEIKKIYWKLFLMLGSRFYGPRGVFTLLYKLTRGEVYCDESQLQSDILSYTDPPYYEDDSYPWPNGPPEVLDEVEA